MIADAFYPSDLTALVLDENHFERGISLDQLRAMGFGRVIGAQSTLEAWDALRRGPHIMLMEWLGEGLDALDFVRRVRLSEDLPNRAVSIFMLTARGSQAQVEAARTHNSGRLAIVPLLVHEPVGVDRLAELTAIPVAATGA